MGLRLGHPSIIRPVVIAFAIGMLGLTSLAQQPKVLAPHKPIPPRVPKALERLEPGVSRSMVGGLWMIDANRRATMYLRNGLEMSSITVTPNLYLSNGAKYALAPVKLEASGTAVISINEALRQKGISPWATLSGYVEVEYAWAWDPLCVTVTSTDLVHSEIFTYGLQPSLVEGLRFHLSKPRVKGMYAVEGLWWKAEAGVTGFVGLSNTTAEPVDARVEVNDSEGKMLEDYGIRVSPHGTKLVALRALDQVKAGGTGGVRVLHTGAQEGLLINGGLEDQSTGYSANLPFHYTFTSAPQQAGAEVYAELGLMTGAADPMMQFPSGTAFTPFSVARNVSDEPLSITPTVYWMQWGAARSAQLRPFTLLPSETRDLDVRSLLARAGLGEFNGSVNLILEARGRSRSLLLASGSVDQKNTYVFQVLPHGIQESAAKTISYWSTGNGDDTMVTVWNPADEAQDYRFTLSFTGGEYRLPIHLEARATRAFNISEIIQDQIPDDNGNIVPATVHEGSARIAGKYADNEEILVALDASTYNVRKATCTYYCISCDGVILAYVVVTPFSLGMGKTNQLSFTAKLNTGSQFSSSGTWSSNKTSVATVSAQNGGNNGLVTGVSPGTATFFANGSGDVFNSNYCAYDPFCPYVSSFQGNGPGNVIPTVSISCQLTDMAVGTSFGIATCFAQNVSPAGGVFSWQTNNTTTVSLSCTNSGCGSSVDYTATAASTSVGDTKITVTYTFNGQSASSTSSPITVHRPTSLKTNSTTANYRTVTCTQPCLASPGSGNCTVKSGTSCSYSEPLTRRYYSVLDQFGNAFENVNLSTVPVITEQLTASKGTCGGNGVEKGKTGGSPFYDEFGKCDSCCETGGPGCTSTASQTLFSNGYNVRQESISVTCKAATLTP